MAVELGGIATRKPKLPILLDHRSDRIVGYADSFMRGPDGFVVEGSFVDSDDADKVKRALASGFPWEASISIDEIKSTRVREGESLTVNGGHVVNGPGLVVSTSNLREVSFTALGADQNTSAEALSAHVAEIELERAQEGEPVPTIESLKKDHPELVAKLQKEATDALAASVEEARAEGVKQGRKEAAEILGAAQEHQRDLALKCVADGDSVGDAALKFCADLKANPPKPAAPEKDEPDEKELELKRLREGNQSLGTSPKGSEGGDPLRLKWEKMSEAEKGEFWDDFETYKEKMALAATK